MFVLNMLCVVLLGCAAVFPVVVSQVEPSPTTNGETAVEPVGRAEERSDSARLPTSLQPRHYTLQLQPLLHGNLSILGHLEIQLEVIEATDKVVLNMADIITRNDTVKLVAVDSDLAIPITKQTYHPYHQTYTAHLAEVLEVGRIYELSMEFEGFLNDKLVGFYLSSYTDKDGRDRRLANTQFSPTDARRAFPCFDEPGFKATFDIRIAREKNMTALSNMPLVSSEPLLGQEGWVMDTFNTSVPMSTYVVGFLVCDFASIESTRLNHTAIKIWSRPDAVLQANFALEIVPTVLTYLEDYFSIDFPLPKLDMAAVPDFKFSGMENWGLVLYRETALLYEPGVSSAANQKWAALVIGHEVAHMWFGNLVTPAWWSDLWLKEGFASFMGYNAINHAEPSWKIADRFVIDYQKNALHLDSLKNSHPINIPVNHPDEISEIFDEISYDKGASLIRMMQHYLGENIFRRGLTNYLNGLKYSNAVQDDLWQYLSEAWQNSSRPANLTVKAIMDTWTLQKGYPVITVTRNGTSATFAQEWFRLDQQHNSIKENVSWWVPISYTSQDALDFQDTRPTLWLANDNQAVEVNNMPEESKWLVVNLQAAGYYRVHYDATTWSQLSHQLLLNHTIIHQVNRALLIDDAFNLARAGYINYPTVLKLSSYLRSETDYVPWASANDVLQYLVDMFGRSSGYGQLRQYILTLITPLYDLVGFDDMPDHPHLTQFKRILAVKWACKLGHQPCVDEAKLLFKDWLNAPANESVLSPNTRKEVLCTGISEGGEHEWDVTWTRYIQSNVGGEKSTILEALGCSKEIWILSRYLERAFSPGSGIKKQNAQDVFKAVASNTVGRDLAWNFMQNRWHDIFQFFGPGSRSLAKLVKEIGETFNTPLDLKELERFKTDNAGQLGSSVRSLEQGLESTEINIAWMDTHYSAILEWLNNNVESNI